MRLRAFGRDLGSILTVTGLVLAPMVGGMLTAGPAGASPDGFVQFATGPENCQLASIDVGTGVVTPLPHSGADVCAPDIAETSDGRVFGIQQTTASPDVHLLQYNTTTGAPTDLGKIGTFHAVAPFGLLGGITFDAAGNLFVEMVGLSGTGGDPNCAGNSVCLYRVNPAAPSSATFIGQGPFETDLEFFAAACDGRAVTLQGEGPGPGSTSSSWPSASSQPSNPGPGVPHGLDIALNGLLVARSLATGAVTPIGNVGATTFVTGLAFDSTGTLWGVGSFNGGPVTVLTVDPSTGVATQGAAISGQPEGAIALGLALPLTCPAPAPPAPTIVAAFTG